MKLRRWRGDARIDGLLRAERAQAPEELVTRLAARARAERPLVRRVPRPVLAAGLSAVMLVALAAVGGMSYAASAVSRIVTANEVDFGKKMAVATFQTSAAADQYGGTDVSENTKSQPTSSGQSGSVQVQAPPPAAGQQPVQVAVNWSPTTFSAPVVVHVDPTPPTITSTALVGGGNQLVSIVVTDQAGQPVRELADPIDVTFANPPQGFVPVISTDGVNFRSVPRLAGTTLPAGQADGYYADANGTIHILTRHLTVFAVLYKANVNVSESGRKTPQAGSGLFGDPTRNHVGAPDLRRVGDTIVPVNGRVPFSFFVSEQASTWISIYDADGNALPIFRNGTTIRGSAYSGRPVKNLHLVIRRPGTINTKLKVAPGRLVAGKTYRIRVTTVDFDGNKTTRFATFKA